MGIVAQGTLALNFLEEKRNRHKKRKRGTSKEFDREVEKTCSAEHRESLQSTKTRTSSRVAPDIAKFDSLNTFSQG